MNANGLSLLSLLAGVPSPCVGQSLNELARERVFEPLGMTRSSFLFDAEIQRNYSLGHDAQGTPSKLRIRPALASTTLHTTASDLARFGAHLASEIRTEGYYSALAKPAVILEAVGDVEHSWGPGLGFVTDGSRIYVFHTGNNVIFIADFMYGVDENLGYALLTNSSNGPRITAAVQRRIFGRQVRR